MAIPSSSESLTFAEHRLWSRLSGMQLDGLAFQRKAQVGPHVADFFSLEVKLAIEVDGPVTAGEADTEFARERYFETLGLRVLRFTEGQVLEDLEWVLGAIRFAVEGRPSGKFAIRSQLAGKPPNEHDLEESPERTESRASRSSEGNETGVFTNAPD